MTRTGIVACLAIGAAAVASTAFAEPPLAEVSYLGTSVEFSPRVWGHGFILRVKAPDGSVVEKTIRDGVPSFDLSQLKGPVINGRYKYELRLIVFPPRQGDAASYKSIAAAKPRVKVPSLSGSFLVAGGRIVSPGGAEAVSLSTQQGLPDAPDLLVNEDLHVLGLVGIGTMVPDHDLHIVSGYSPTIRIQQDGSLGLNPQSWELVANDGAFFIVDDTNGYMPMAISPGAPNASLSVRSNGNVGMGTWDPRYDLEVRKTGENATFLLHRTDGARNCINATDSFGNFGTVTNHPLRLVVNGAWQMRINNASAIQMANGAYLTAGGVWTNASSRALKQDIEGLSVEEATSTLAGLEPVKFAYKANGERHVGFIAEDVPELVAGADRDGLSPMDVVAMLTRVVQQQQQALQEQQEINNQLRARISALEAR